MALTAEAAVRDTVSPTKIENRCEIITARVDLILSRYAAHKVRYDERFQKVSEKLTALIPVLKTKGYDTTKLEADLTQLNQYREQFKTSYQDYINHLNQSKTLACGNSEGAFKAEIEAARTDLQKVRELSLQIRLYIIETIKPDLQASKKV